MPNVGPLEIGIVLVVVLLIFGPKRLPELGGSLGRGIKSLRRGLDSDGGEEAKASVESPSKPSS